MIKLQVLIFLQGLKEDAALHEWGVRPDDWDLSNLLDYSNVCNEIFMKILFILHTDYFPASTLYCK